nr:hypothetical protein [Pseudaminobacter sp.]
LLSATTFDHIKDKVDIAFEDIGLQNLKNIENPVRAYRVSSASARTSVVAQRGATKPSVAVLPFNNMSADPEQEYFSDGITEDIITELSRFRSLSVIARNSSFSFKGRAVDIAEVGRALKVQYVVEGSVRKVGQRVRITAQLIEVATGAHIWADKYDRELAEIFAVQDEVTERLIWALTGNIVIAEIAHAKRRLVENMEVYDLVLRSDDLLNRYTAHDANAAIEMLNKAASLAPTTGTVFSWLARAYLEGGIMDHDQSKFDRSLEAAERALQLGEADDWTDAIVAYVLGWRRNYQDAEVRISRALAKNPHDAITIMIRISVFLWSGKIEQAREIAIRAVKLDPVNPLWFHEYLCYAEYLLGNYEESLCAFKRIMPVGYYRVYAYMAACLGQLGKTQEAQAAWQRCLQLRPGYTVVEFDRSGPYGTPQREQWLDGLSKAGL